jgi:hypothetical protein
MLIHKCLKEIPLPWYKKVFLSLKYREYKYIRKTFFVIFYITSIFGVAFAVVFSDLPRGDRFILALVSFGLFLISFFLRDYETNWIDS